MGSRSAFNFEMKTDRSIISTPNMVIMIRLIHPRAHRSLMSPSYGYSEFKPYVVFRPDASMQLSRKVMIIPCHRELEAMRQIV